MASSRMEVCWAEPGPGKGPLQRRRWAWAEEGKDADGSTRSLGEKGPFPKASSPELLEDFRRAQQCLQPLEWGPDSQPGGCRDPESGGSAEEESEAEDVDSPESSNLPLGWLPQQDPQPGMTEEEPDETLGGAEVQEAGESSPRLGYETDLSSGGNGNTSPMALGWCQPTGGVASGNQASGDKLPEHSEVNPTVDFSSARSWSSGTVSLNHPSDSLDSTWEGETDVPQPPALAESLPQSPSHHLLNPNDRTGGSVALVTPTEFQESSAPPAQSLQCPADRWRREATSLSCPQPGDQSWKRTRISPKPLPSRFTGSISPLNPSPGPARQDRPPPRPGATLAGHSSSGAPKYGRGRLNYPLPDFSKVGPRVKFPKDESYRPPKARSHSRLPESPARPLIFKSPAEIVREVLLSSGEVCPGKDPPPTHPITRVPQEFQTPEQATKLVHQLQEDYHKLLTKYAEAENTIDQLRLGAKVNLYSDLPQPSHSIHMGTVPQGTKVLSFSIPQPHSVERWPGPAEGPQASEASGWPSALGDPSPSSSPSAPTPGWLPENPGIIQNQPAAEPAQELASQASRFLAKVESFVELIQAGQLAPRDQLKGFQRLKAAHTALEEEYLKACREQHLAQQLAGSKGAPGKFDPGRELEAEIFQLGIRLEELKDHVDQNQQKPEQAGSDLALDSPPAGPSPEQPAGLPSPLEQAPTPAIQTLCPKPDATSIGPHPLHVNLDLSATSNEAEDRPLGLPGPLRHKELQMEQDLHGLLERYLSVKSPAEAMRMEEEEAGGQGRTLEVDGPAPAPGKAAATRLPTRQLPAQAERSHRGSLEETVEQMAPVKPADFHSSMARDSHLQGLDKAGAAPPGPSRHPHPRGTKSSVASHQGSLTSLEGSGISERLPQKSLCQAGGPHQEEPWMASPETDSGFVGSETSRVSPLTQTPEHRLSHISTPGTLGQPFTPSEPRDAASHRQTRALPVPRRAAEPSTPRSRAQRPPSGQDSPLRQRASSFCLERALTAEMAVPGSEFKGRRQMSEQLPHSMTISPSPTPAPVEAVPPRGPTETTSTFLLTRTGRDQAIRELQQEVSRLRLRLEDSLHQPPQGSPTRPASSFDCPARARARDRLVGSSATWGSHYGSKSTERLSGEPGSAEQAVPAGRRRTRSSSVPREVPQLSLSSESEPTSPRLFSEKGRTTEDSPQAAWDGTRRVGGTGRPDRVTFRGQYTGQEYHVSTPKTVPRGSGPVSCPQCRPVRTQDPGGTVTKGPPGPSPTETLRCPLCGQVGSPSEGDGPDSATSGPEKAATRRNAPSTPSPKQRSKRAESPPRPPPGLWYLAAAPSAPTPPAFAYVSSVPVMPYPSATVFYVPPGPTSAPSARPAAEWPPAASSRPVGGPQRSIQLDLEDLEELNKALSRAVQAAESVRSTTKHMSRSLSAELRQARGLRGSCLF
uniref:Microtubule organization protein AKNA isoform X1 n=1 Tax=Camelus bactrianus TaxID=9837 RepID=A0A9W3G947_CAMBA|nr:microtubule organization protein AKNA isoform X1 [Camelus bactrianus]XP_045374196.1 microtubule organization protein AKNA isoform X1 [Camelus bactrianus]XP_045374197.1 microtubule organization protein AKNA isoform X1 [Camelus bactrianus]